MNLNPPGLRDLCTFRFLRWSQTWLSPTVRDPSFFLGIVVGALASEDQGKKVVENLSLLPVPCNQVSHFFLEGPHTSSGLPFITNLLQKLFLLPWPPCPYLILSRLWLFSPDPWVLKQLLFILHVLPVLVSTICRLPFCVSLLRSSLFIQAGLLSFLPDFHCVGMHHSSAWRRWSLKIQLSWLFFPSELNLMVLLSGTLPAGCIWRLKNQTQNTSKMQNVWGVLAWFWKCFQPWHIGLCWHKPKGAHFWLLKMQARKWSAFFILECKGKLHL